MKTTPFAPLRIHPENPKLLEFRGAPLALICATEHYGAVMNRPFDFRAYLTEAKEKKQTFTRLFTLFRELQSECNPYSTCKPETIDYIAPYSRTDGELGLDRHPKFDLTQWNPEFFERLHEFLSLSSEAGIVVEMTLLSNVYTEAVWALSPLHPGNNINGTPAMPWHEYITLRHPGLFEWQAAYVRKMVEETNRYDHIFYEICNEPAGRWADEGAPTLPEVDDWQWAIGRVIRETEAGLPFRHLIAGQEAFAWSPEFEQPSDQSFDTFPVDIVNLHPLPNTTHAGVSYHLGEFGIKQLKLREMRDLARACYGQSKPMNYDEDNTASQFRDLEGWTIHRKRAWISLLSGAHYGMIDFSITIHTPTGLPAARAALRSWMGYLSEFFHSFDLGRSRALTLRVDGLPAAVVEAVYGLPGEDLAVYLADARERKEPGCGEPVQVIITLDLPDGDYEVRTYAPTSGLYSPATTLRGGGSMTVNLPSFTDDLVLRIVRKRDI